MQFGAQELKEMTEDVAAILRVDVSMAKSQSLQGIEDRLGKAMKCFIADCEAEIKSGKAREIDFAYYREHIEQSGDFIKTFECIKFMKLFEKEIAEYEKDTPEEQESRKKLLVRYRNEDARDYCFYEPGSMVTVSHSPDVVRVKGTEKENWIYCKRGPYRYYFEHKGTFEYSLCRKLRAKVPVERLLDLSVRAVCLYIAVGNEIRRVERRLSYAALAEGKEDGNAAEKPNCDWTSEDDLDKLSPWFRTNELRDTFMSEARKARLNSKKVGKLFIDKTNKQVYPEARDELMALLIRLKLLSPEIKPSTFRKSFPKDKRGKY